MLNSAKYQIKVNDKSRKACENYSKAIKACRNKMRTANTILDAANVALAVIMLY